MNYSGCSSVNYFSFRMLGFFQSEEGQSTCNDCPPQYYCLTNTIEPVICPAYSYCPSGSVSPTICPDGSYTEDDVVGLADELDCQLCPSGIYIFI